MRLVGAVLVVLCLAGTGYSVETWSAGTLTVTADSLGSMVDPLGQQDFNAASYAVPAMAKDDFNALAGLKTITFNQAPNVRQGTTLITAYYDATNSVTFSNFGAGTGYNYSGGTSSGRNAHSGTQSWHQLGLVEGNAAGGPFHPDATVGNEGLNWFKADIAVSEAGKGVSALGFIVDARDDQSTAKGNIWVTLNDASEVMIPYDVFGTTAGSGLFFGYEAPAGKSITRIEATRLSGSGNSFLAMDDLTFVVTPEPMTLALLAMGGLLAARRRHA